MVVQHVHFDGLGRTKDDIIMYEIGDVFKAKNLIEARILSAWVFYSLLKTLGSLWPHTATCPAPASGPEASVGAPG